MSDATYRTEISAPVAASRSVWIGRVLSGLAIAALGLDAVMKLAAPQLMIDTSPPLGLAPDVGLYRSIGAILLGSVILYALPRTAFLGALLITAFLGGAVAINVRADMPLFGNTLFGVYISIVVWTGLWLRDRRVRALLTGVGKDGSE